MFLELLWATGKITVLGFALGRLYYSVFSEKLPPKEGVFGKSLSAKPLTILASIGFLFIVIISPVIALEGIDVVRAFVSDIALGAYGQYLLGAWIELGIILGWMLEYTVQRHTRQLPKLNFQL